MIVIRLIGGLGNQMFQYATARRLAHIRHAELKFDLSWFETQSSRFYSLSPFNIMETIASSEEIASLTLSDAGVIERIFSKVLLRAPRPARTHIMEKHFHFNQDVLNLPNNIYLDGYWQSERYFQDIAEIIRYEFSPKKPPEEINQRIAKLMSNCESVSVHIRHGDYISDPVTSQFHGICDLDYYLAASEYIARSVSQPHFFVFSDDPEWGRKHFCPPFETTFIDHNTGKHIHHEDMWLMSQCKQHIIANSTFSWWGAWLNSNPDKIVIAPKKWFKTDTLNSKDLIPDTWITL